MDHYTRVENDNKTTSYKKFGAALGVTGITVAAALLLAGSSKAPAQTAPELIQMPSEFVSQDHGIPFVDELWSNTNQTNEQCLSNWHRIWADNQLSIDAPGFQNQLNSNGKFEDPEFPANMSSLYWPRQEQYHHGQIHMYQNYEQQYGIVWKRPNELRGYGEPSLWGSQGVSVEASKQGALGDCWFLSSASAVAAVPERIHRMFKNTEYSSDGAFEMFFYIRGEKVSVIIDDRIPVLNLGDNYQTPYPPVNSKPSPQGAWWLVLMEKAFAKLNVNYTQISGGTPGEALRAITGMPVSSHNSNQMTDDQLWDIVVNGLNKKNPMAAACQVSHYNMVSGHAYGIVGAAVLHYQNGQEAHKLIKMRNPWGVSKYNGPWSADSDTWTNQWKQEADLAGAKEGEYYVSLSDWRTFYAQAFNTHYREDWKIDSIEGSPDVFEGDSQSSEWISFTNSETQQVVLECTQWQSRLFPGGCKNEYTPQKYAFVLYDKNMQQVQTEPTMAQCDGGAMNMHNHPAGDYIIRVVNFGGSDQGHEQVWKLNSYGTDTTLGLKRIANPYN